MTSTRRPKTWLITDTHFNHNKLHTEGWRPADFHQRILDNWKALVHHEDTVYHLGDVIMGRAAELAGIMASLPGTKYLVRGNHDMEPTAWYLKRGFSFVATGILRHEVWLTHRPAETLPSGALLNVHGHLHDRVDKRGLETWAHNKLLAMECTEYKPVEWDEFIDSDALAQGRRLLRAGYAALDAVARDKRSGGDDPVLAAEASLRSQGVAV
jgi:calcineurin-like phosphoesterase family protein